MTLENILEYDFTRAENVLCLRKKEKCNNFYFPHSKFDYPIDFQINSQVYKFVFSLSFPSRVPYAHMNIVRVYKILCAVCENTFKLEMEESGL